MATDRSIAEGTPEQIKGGFARVGIIDITSVATTDDHDRLAKLPGARRVMIKRDDRSTRITVQTDLHAPLDDDIASVFADRPETHVTHRRPTLEEAYLSLF